MIYKVIAFIATTFILSFIAVGIYINISEWLYSQIILLFLDFQRLKIWIKRKKMMVLEILDICLALFLGVVGFIAIAIAIAAMMIDEDC